MAKEMDNEMETECLGFRGLIWISSWTPKICKMTAFRAVIMGLGLLFHILLRFRY